MESRAKFLGHALHQQLIPFPLGLLVTSVIFDVIHLATGGDQWALVAFWMIAAGVIGGLLAAIFGAIDYTAIPAGTRAKRVATLHGLGNVVMVALFSLSWWLRTGSPTDPSTLAFVLSVAAAGLSGFTGWLGGELVDRMGVGVDEGAHLNAPSSLSGRPASEGLRPLPPVSR